MNDLSDLVFAGTGVAICFCLLTLSDNLEEINRSINDVQSCELQQEDPENVQWRSL